MSYKIVFADDEVRFHKLIKIFLSHEDYEITCFTDGLAVLEYLGSHKDVDLVLLDVMMPGLDGRETCREIQENFQIPVIMLTALCDEGNEIQGINSGADDYIGKPFSKDLLIARIKALLRRTKQKETTLLLDEDIEFTEAKMQVKISETEISLTPKEFSLLKYLVLNRKQVLSRAQILNNVWGYDYYGDPRTVDTHIKSLRSQLKEEAKRIKTIRGRGYCYTGVED